MESKKVRNSQKSWFSFCLFECLLQISVNFSHILRDSGYFMCFLGTFAQVIGNWCLHRFDAFLDLSHVRIARQLKSREIVTEH